MRKYLWQLKGYNNLEKYIKIYIHDFEYKPMCSLVGGNDEPHTFGLRHGLDREALGIKPKLISHCLLVILVGPQAYSPQVD